LQGNSFSIIEVFPPNVLGGTKETQYKIISVNEPKQRNPLIYLVKLRKGTSKMLLKRNNIIPATLEIKSQLYADSLVSFTLCMVE
jgi:hypothetical protein